MKNKVYHILGIPVNVKVLSWLANPECICTANETLEVNLDTTCDEGRFVTNGQIYELSTSDYGHGYMSRFIIRNADYILFRYDINNESYTRYYAEVARPMNRKLYLQLEQELAEFRNAVSFYCL